MSSKTVVRRAGWIRTVLVFLCVLAPSLCMWVYLFPGFLQPDHAATIAYLATGTLNAWHSIFWALLAKPLLYDLPSYGWYGLAQVLVYAAAITFSLLRLRKLGVVKNGGMWALVAVFALSPCYVLYNVTYSSDIVFSALLVPYTTLLVELAVTRLESLRRPGFLAGGGNADIHLVGVAQECASDPAAASYRTAADAPRPMEADPCGCAGAGGCVPWRERCVRRCL